MNEKNYKVSIITVVYNGAKTIEQTILSVLGQSYKNIEYIIIDGLSTDGTQEIVRKYKDSIAYFVSEKDDGLYYAMNKGIQKATGDIVGIINSDDWYAEDAIEKIVFYFEHNEVDLVYGNVINIDQNGIESIIVPKPIDNIWFQNAIHHPSVFVKRSVYEKFGIFNTKYKIAADYDLLLQFYSHKVKFGYIDEVIAYFRIGGISSVLNRLTEDETYEISKAHIHDCPYKNDAVLKLEEIRKWCCFERKISDNKGILTDLLWQYCNQKIDRIIIFGTGIWGERCYKILRDNKIEVDFWVDNDSLKWNQELYGIKVLNPDELRIMKAIILIAVKKEGNTIKKQLDSMGNRELKCVTISELEEISIKRGMQ